MKIKGGTLEFRVRRALGDRTDEDSRRARRGLALFARSGTRRREDVPTGAPCCPSLPSTSWWRASAAPRPGASRRRTSWGCGWVPCRTRPRARELARPRACTPAHLQIHAPIRLCTRVNNAASLLARAGAVVILREAEEQLGVRPRGRNALGSSQRAGKRRGWGVQRRVDQTIQALDTENWHSVPVEAISGDL